MIEKKANDSGKISPGFISINGTIRIMGIINVTPDSFSDGGLYADQSAVLDQVRQMVNDGADIIDIGGESTRPFSKPVSLDEELQRVIPAIRLVKSFFDIPISIDTTKAEVARQALEAGADIINDVSGLLHDPDMSTLATQTGAHVIIMHMKGTPKDMQVSPTYNDVVADISSSLNKRAQWAMEQGISSSKIIIDPGIGFGKTVNHNLTIIRQLENFSHLGFPLLVGHSRKAFIGSILSLPDPKQRDESTAVISAICAMKGVSILRVHDVRRTAQALQLVRAISEGYAG